MRITGSFPVNIARAYGVTPAQRAAPLPQTDPVSPARRAQPVDAREPSGNVQRLIAGRVNEPVEFGPVRPPASTPGAYQLYNRAADKIEAAVAVHVGRTLDVKG